jgi:LysR family hydrogen peroxide-inducible transcriptional activator
MQLRDIQYVIAVAEAKGFSRAAERIHISQPAVSQSIQRLEARLGVKLFYRRSSGVSLTHAGEVFVKHGKAIIAESESLLQRMAELREERDRELRVSASPFYRKCWLDRVLPVFSERHPDVRVKVVEAFSDDQESMLQNGKVDLIVVPYLRSIPRVHFQELFWDEIALAVPAENQLNRLLEPKRKCGLTPDDLRLFSGEDFVMYKEGRRMRQRSMDLCREAGFEPRIILETHSCESISEVVRRGMGIGFLPISIRLLGPPGEQPVLYRLLSSLAKRYVSIGYLDAGLSKAGEQFVRTAAELSETFGDEAVAWPDSPQAP